MQKFIIDTPPPTVSGQLHMGHVFSYSHADFIARYKRMRGYNVIYPIGFDDNGLPTERLVEKQKGIRGSEFEKQNKKNEFIKECESVIEEAEIEFEKLFKTLGYSYDWNLKYQTISDSSAKIAQWSFKDLLDKNLIYQAFAPVYWDIIDQTALANADIEELEQDGFESYFNFKICDKNGNEADEMIEIMTTRPEMLPACLAVMYSLQHKDANNFTERFAKVPLTDLIVPLIKDDTISIEKGTGAMMVCSYGDWHDVELIKKHNLKPFSIVNKNGWISKSVIWGSDIFFEDPEFYSAAENNTGTARQVNDWWKTPQKAREAIIKYCEENSLFSQPKIAIKQIVKVGERSKYPLEIIETNQFYIKLKDFKEDLLLISKHIRFHPEHMRNRLEQWINAIDRDWCISRDRFMGIEIPKCKNLQKTNQVFDTWFTSSCTPQIVARYLNENFGDGKKFRLPMQMRTQGHEIIRTWAFYTIVKAYFHGITIEELTERQQFLNEGKTIQDWFKYKGFDKLQIIKERGLIPWENIVLSGWCLASDKTKMSKSKGNIITPQALIEEKGVDTIRYWAGCNHLGVDTPYNEIKFIDARRLLTKLENAYKFTMLIKNNANLLPEEFFNVNLIIEEFDKWILFRFFKMLKCYENEMDNFEYAKAKDVSERFFWEDFCDNYLEIIKVRSYGLEAFIYKDKELSELERIKISKGQKSITITLLILIEGILKVFAPFLIEKTENLYQNLCKELKLKEESIHSQGNWVNEDLLIKEFTNLENCETIINLISFVREQKSYKKLSMKAEVILLETNKNIDKKLESDFRNVINGTNATILETESAGRIEFIEPNSDIKN